MIAPIEQAILSRRFKERRLLAASTVVVMVGVALVAGAMGAEPGASSGSESGAGWRSSWWMAAAFLAPPYIVHGVWMARRHAADPILLPLLHLMTGLGMLLMMSIGGVALGWPFAIGTAAGWGAFLAASL